VRRLPQLVGGLADGLQPLLDMPFAFFGHSLGAIIAFEVARELRHRGAPQPVHLFVSAHGPGFLPSGHDPLHILPDSEFAAEVGRFGGIPEVFLRNKELLDIILPVLRADFQLYETHKYIPEAPLDIPVTAIGGLQDASFTADDLNAWQRETTAEFILRMLPGGHFYLNESMHLLLFLISRQLARHCRAEDCRQPEGNNSRSATCDAADEQALY
jgi:medium-chain acyl-[acyl-carrier-protein] hydrolase